MHNTWHFSVLDFIFCFILKVSAQHKIHLQLFIPSCHCSSQAILQHQQTLSPHYSPLVQITYENLGQHSSPVVISFTVKNCLIFFTFCFTSFNHFRLVINPHRRIFCDSPTSVRFFMRDLSGSFLEKSKKTPGNSTKFLVPTGKSAYKGG